MRERLRALPDGPGQLWWGLAALAASVVLAAWSAWPVYETWRVAVVAAAGFVIGAGSVVIGAALGRRAWTSGLIAAGLYLALVVPVAVPGALADPGRVLRGLVEGVAGIVLGWKQLLTLSVPAGEYQAVLVPLLVAVAACTLLATALLVRGGRLAPLAAAPMLALPAFGAVFGSSAVEPAVELGPLRIPAPAHVLLAALAVAVVVAWLIGRTRLARSRAIRAARAQSATVRQQAESRPAALRRQLLAAGLVVVALGAGLLAAPVATVFGPREALRDDVDPWLVLRAQPSPLASYRAAFAGAAHDRELFAVQAPVNVDRVRIATLDAYDGQTFRVGETELNRFTRVPRAAAPDAPVRITIGEGWSGVWVPVLSAADPAPAFDGPRADVLADAYYGSAALDAAVAVPAGEEPGLRPGDGYRLEAPARADTTGFATASGGEPLLDASAHPMLDEWIELQELPRTGASVLELVERLRARGYLSHASRDDADAEPWIRALAQRADYVFAPVRSGHSTARIEELFTSLLEQERRAGADAPDEMLIAAVGDDEQFATAAALIARHQGFESRVVLGVRLGGSGAEEGVLPCADVCTGANLTAWAEARSADGSWVVLDATPQFATPPTLIREGEEPPRNPTQVDAPTSDVLDPPAAQSDDASGAPSDETADENWTDAILPIVLAVLAAATAVALVLLPLLVFPVAKRARRRMRRRAREPEAAMVGAWDELVDIYIDHGIEVPQGLTRTETADAVDRPAALELAELVDRAVFSEHPPAVETSAHSWRLLDQERREIVRKAGFRTRVRAALTPASLLRRIRAERTARPAGRTHRKAAR